MKQTILLLILSVISIELFAQGYTSREVVERGVGLGSVIAVVISWPRNESVLWAIIHGMLSWLYVIYYVIVRVNED